MLLVSEFCKSFQQISKTEASFGNTSNLAVCLTLGYAKWLGKVNDEKWASMSSGLAHNFADVETEAQRKEAVALIS